MKVGDILIAKKDYISEFNDVLVLSINKKYEIELINKDWETGADVIWIDNIAYTFKETKGFLHTVSEFFYTEEELRYVKLDSI